MPATTDVPPWYGACYKSKSSCYSECYGSHFFIWLYSSITQMCILIQQRLVLPIWKTGYIFNSLLIQKFLFHSYIYIYIFFPLSYLLKNKGCWTCRGGWSEFSWLNINDAVQHISVWSTHGHLNLEAFSNSDSVLLANAEVVFCSSIRRNLIFGCLFVTSQLLLFII